jgi:hypothetical protein
MKLTIDMLRALERRLREAGVSRRITPLLRSRLFKRWLQNALAVFWARAGWPRARAAP